jgi:hypothetical protein
MPKVGNLRTGNTGKDFGNAKAVSLEVKGLKQTEDAFATLMSVVTDDSMISADIRSRLADEARQTIADYLGGAAQIIRDQVIMGARGRRWPTEVIKSIFKWSSKNEAKGRRRGSLAGIRLGAPPHYDEKIFRLWNAKYDFQPMSFTRGRRGRLKKAKRPRMNWVGQELGISLARIYESGTRNPTAWTRRAWPASHVFENAVSRSQVSAVRFAQQGYEKAIEMVRVRFANEMPT